MITLAHKSAPIDTVKQRRREVEQRLATFGLRRGPFGLPGATLNFEENHIRRLSAALETLGPVFCAFGQYLSTRIDLLDTNDCLELASLPDWGEESSPDAIRRLINQELGSPLENVYCAFEEKPFASGLFHQQHHAWLIGGDAVIVKILHPEVEELLHCDLQLLHLLKAAFLSKAWTESQFEGAIEDFRLTVKRQIDFSEQARALATVAKDTQVFGILKTPLVHDQSSTSKVLTIERLPGKSLEELLTFIPEIDEDQTRSVEAEEHYLIARRLCAAWLRQTLLGSLFPSEPSPANITILPNNQIAFADGCYAGLTSEVKANLWSYLLAAVTENPDVACSCLLKELEEGKHSRGEDSLRQGFRQIVPFAESEWTNIESTKLAEHLFLHWRLARESDYRPRPHLPPFYRGLFIIAGIAQRLAPARDALKDAWQDVRVMGDVDRFREMLSMREFGEQMEKYFGMMIDLPQRLDQALTLMAEGNTRLKLRVPERTEPVQKRTPSALAGLLLIAAVIVLLSHYLKDYFTESWSQSIKALVFLLLAVMLLRNGSRS